MSDEERERITNRSFHQIMEKNKVSNIRLSYNVSSHVLKVYRYASLFFRQFYNGTSFMTSCPGG